MQHLPKTSPPPQLQLIPPPNFFLLQQLDELKTTVQPFLQLAEAMQKHSTELQRAKESIDSFTRMLGEFVPTIKQIVPKIPKIIVMTETFSPSQGSSYSTQPAGSFAPPPVKDSTNIRKWPFIISSKLSSGTLEG